MDKRFLNNSTNNTKTVNKQNIQRCRPMRK